MKLAPLKILLIFSIIFLNIGCDQSTKQLAKMHLENEPAQFYLNDAFRLTYAENPGAFFGTGQDLPKGIKTLVLQVLPSLALSFLLIFVLFSKKLSMFQVIAMSFMLGGGMSNIFDRIAHEKVVDFMHIKVGVFQTGIFNVADVGIMIGMGLMLCMYFIGMRKNNF